jgi:hypothetical protein
MAASPKDIRMVDRERRRYGAEAPVKETPTELPDLAANVAEPTAEELEKLKADLVAEREVRSARIVRFIAEGPLKPVPRAVIPVSENDL